MSIPPYVFEPHHEVVRDYAEWSGRPLEELVADLCDFRRIVREEWESLPPGGFAERARAFYGASRTYALDLLRVNTSRADVLAKLDRFEPRVLASLRAHPGRRLLEFGGGTGVFCQAMAEEGRAVTYVDLPGPVAEFAAWRFRKLGLDVEVLLVPPGEPPRLGGTWDLLFSDAVLEHVPDPEATARTLARALSPGGFLALLVDLEGENPEIPMHREVDVAAVHAALEAEGLLAEFGKGAFASGWRRP